MLGDQPNVFFMVNGIGTGGLVYIANHHVLDKVRSAPNRPGLLLARNHEAEGGLSEIRLGQASPPCPDVHSFLLVTPLQIHQHTRTSRTKKNRKLRFFTSLTLLG